MTAYYNEIDPHAAAWLRELIKDNLIAPGYVDERSISDVTPSDLDGFTQCHFFAGIGGWSLALRLAGWPDDRPIWTGSCPCQPFSTSGKKQGVNDERHLWPDFYKLINDRKPAIVVGEQVASWEVVGRTGGKPKESDGPAWIDIVCHDLEESNYATGFTVFPAAGIGSPSKRDRCYWLALEYGSGKGLEGYGEPGEQQIPKGWKRAQGCYCETGSVDRHSGRDGVWRYAQSGIVPMVAGLSDSVVPDGNSSQEARKERLKGYGNAINADAAAAFIEASMMTISS